MDGGSVEKRKSEKKRKEKHILHISLQLYFNWQLEKKKKEKKLQPTSSEKQPATPQLVQPLQVLPVEHLLLVISNIQDKDSHTCAIAVTSVTNITAVLPLNALKALYMTNALHKLFLSILKAIVSVMVPNFQRSK